MVETNKFYDLENRVNILQGRVNALSAELAKLRRGISHPVTIGYINKRLGGTESGVHALLSGLTADDHLQYLTVGRHDITARHPDEVIGTIWTDYSATSTIVGWSSFTTKYIAYRKIGKTMLVVWELVGTSDDTVTTFTMPTAARGVPPGNWWSLLRVENNSVVLVDPGLAQLVASQAVINLYPTTTPGAWTAVNTKGCWGQMFYQVA